MFFVLLTSTNFSKNFLITIEKLIQKRKKKKAKTHKKGKGTSELSEKLAYNSCNSILQVPKLLYFVIQASCQITNIPVLIV